MSARTVVIAIAAVILTAAVTAGTAMLPTSAHAAARTPVATAPAGGRTL